MYTVYKTVNLVNGKFYIGVHKTDNPYDDYLGSGKLIKSAIKKYGISNFKKEIIAIFDSKADAYQLESELLVLGEASYNLKAGCYGGFDYLNDGSPQHLERARRAASKGGKASSDKLWEEYRNNPEFKDEFSNKLSESVKKYYTNGGTHSRSFLGREHSDETKLKMSIKAKSRTGQNNPQFGKIWVTDGVINKLIPSSDDMPENFYRGRTTHPNPPI